MSGRPINEWKLRICEKEYPKAMATLEGYLTESAFVAGDHATIADFYDVAAVAA